MGFFKHNSMQVIKSMTIQNHKHIQITYITLTLTPETCAWLSRWFFSPSEFVNKLAGQEPWSWLLIMLKPWLGTWLSEVHYVFNTLLLHSYMQLVNIIIKLEKYPITVKQTNQKEKRNNQSRLHKGPSGLAFNAPFMAKYVLYASTHTQTIH